MRPFLSAALALACLIPGGIVAAAPNAVDLSALAGNYRGRSSVAIEDNQPYRGGARIAIETTTDSVLGVRIRIQASVRTGTSRNPSTASISNLLTFRPSGVVTGKELAPGVAAGAPFTGTYTATPRRLSFTGTFAFGPSSGTYSGTVIRTKEDDLIVRYTVVGEKSSRPLYTYVYKTKLPKKPAPKS